MDISETLLAILKAASQLDIKQCFPPATGSCQPAWRWQLYLCQMPCYSALVISEVWDIIAADEAQAFYLYAELTAASQVLDSKEFRVK